MDKRASTLRTEDFHYRLVPHNTHYSKNTSHYIRGRVLSTQSLRLVWYASCPSRKRLLILIVHRLLALKKLTRGPGCRCPILVCGDSCRSHRRIGNRRSHLSL